MGFPSPGKMLGKNRAVKIIVVVALLLVAAAVYRGMSAGGPKSRRGDFENRAIPVATVAVGRGDLKIFLNGLGTVTPTASVVVHSRVDGQLMRVHFQEGQMVRAGDLLAEIDPRPFQVQLTQAQGQHARDSALLRNAQLDLERYQLLWSQDSIAKQQVDAQQSLVRQYEGAVLADQGQIDSAKLQLAYTQVTAPIAGRVGLRQVDAGNIVHASDANGLVSIAQLQPITVVFTLPEDNLPLIVQKLQAKTPIPVDAYDRQQKRLLASGSLLTIDNQIDATTGTVKLKAQFRNDDNALFPNQFVNVRMQIDTRRDVELLPTAAVQRGAQDNFVYLVNADNTVKLQTVQVGDTEADQVAIESGLKVGDQVVIEGIDKLREGSAVEPVPRGGSGAADKPGAEQKRARANGQGQHRRKDGAPAAQSAPQQ